jgi:hypothetical protein
MASSGSSPIDPIINLIGESGDAWDLTNTAYLYNDIEGTIPADIGDNVNRVNGVIGRLWLASAPNRVARCYDGGIGPGDSNSAVLEKPSSVPASDKPGTGNYLSGFIWAFSVLDEPGYAVPFGNISFYDNNTINQASSGAQVRYRAGTNTIFDGVLDAGGAGVRTFILRETPEDPTNAEIWSDGELAMTHVSGTNNTLDWPSYRTELDGGGIKRLLRRAFVRTGSLSVQEIQELHQWLAGGAS